MWDPKDEEKDLDSSAYVNDDECCWQDAEDVADALDDLDDPDCD